MANTNLPSSNNIGFCGLLTIALIVLKLTHVIDWSWWWVWAPIWVPASVALSVAIVCGIIAVWLTD